MIFLDANASVPPLPVARDALLRSLDGAGAGGGNPSSTHGLGRAARRLIDEARDDVARACASSNKDVFFTSGASEGNRLLVDMLVEHAGRAAAQGKPLVVVSTPLEHPSLHKPLARAAARAHISWRTLPIVDEGVVVDDVAVLAGADVVICTAAHNETGLLVDLDALCAAVQRVGGDDVVVGVDAAQSLGRIGAPPARVDVVVASAHKLGGVAGVGSIVLRRRARTLPPPWVGGGQENGLRPGTEAASLIAAYGAACAVVDDSRRAHAALAPLRDRLEARVVAACGGRALCAHRPRLPNTSAVLFPGVDGDALRLLLDQAGVAVGFGAACSALAPEPSPGLMALGLSSEDTRRVVRFSLAPSVGGRAIDEAVIDDAAARVAAVAARLR